MVGMAGFEQATPTPSQVRYQAALDPVFLRASFATWPTWPLLRDVAALPRAVGALPGDDAKLREFRFPGAQHVRLHLDDVADLSRLEQRAVRNLDSGSIGHEAAGKL